ncbi:MAG TPA: nuclear transport factor 2 family protein [Mycobacteriales bacterium]|nr:nuclear transport factor 2 family protein [Mycobacteriales bacterium]
MTTTTPQTTTDRVAAVASIYEAFGRGDLDALVAPLADDVSWDADWAQHSAQEAGLDMFRPRHGKAEVREFFTALGAFEVHDFQVLDLLASDRQVVVQVLIDCSYPHGGRYRDEELHLWTFHPNGTIGALRHYVDTAKHIAAAAGEDTTKHR